MEKIGIITKASQAVQKNKEANIKEIAQLWMTDKEIYNNTNIGNDVTIEELKADLLERKYISTTATLDYNEDIGMLTIKDEDLEIILTGTTVQTNENQEAILALSGNTYFYDETTIESETLIRYKKVDNKYYRCNENGIIINEEEEEIIEENLKAYISATVTDLTLGTGAYDANGLLLGDSAQNNKSYELGKSEGYSSGYSDGYEVNKDEIYNEGYTKGYADGIDSVQSTENASLIYTYHEHTGSSAECSGCYTKYMVNYKFSQTNGTMSKTGYVKDEGGRLVFY